MVQENGHKYSSMVRPSSKPSSKPSSRPSSRKSNSGKPKEGNGTMQQGENHITQTRSHQQRILNVFQTAFNSVLSSENLTTILQEVKTALFNRDFDKAFGNQDYLDAYAARWSPTRALCYASILHGIHPHLDDLLSQTKPAPQPPPPTDSTGSAEDNNGPGAELRVLSIGGGAAELVALASFLGQQPPSQPLTIRSALLLDVAPWGGAVERLRAALTTRPAVSRYASAAVRAANTAVVDDPGRLAGVTFRRDDVLSLTGEEVSSLVAGVSGPAMHPVLVTLLFTLNELFNSSSSSNSNNTAAGGVAGTTALLFALTGALPAGSLLLVVDSPGSYSEAAVGRGSSRRYPMQWLLDRVLLGTTEGAWEKVEARDSSWFRLSSQDLEYPIPLEDMRYQVHLYRATGMGTTG